MPAPDFNLASWKSLCANLGIEADTVTDAFGRPDLRLDRRAMVQLRDAAIATDQLDVARLLANCLSSGRQS